MMRTNGKPFHKNMHSDPVIALSDLTRHFIQPPVANTERRFFSILGNTGRIVTVQQCMMVVVVSIILSYES